MNNIFSDNITWSIGIIIVLFGIIAAHRLIMYREKRNKFFEEAAKFRSKVLATLEGIYPVTQPWWDENLLPKFQQSVPVIETAVAEFRYFIKDKVKLDAAIKEYRDYCQRRAYQGGRPHMIYEKTPTMAQSKADPVEEFKNIVEHILLFASKK
jgi:hypothetical protein